MDIKIISIGNIKDNDLKSLINKYVIRIQKKIKIELIELKEDNYNDINKTIYSETNKIISILSKYKIYKKFLFNINSNFVDSLKFADIIKYNKNYNNGKIVFIIGGSNGLDYKSLDNHIDLQISFGKITFPHQIFKLILVEQIYRAFKIIGNEKYHK